MKLDEIIAICRQIAQPYCITEGDKFRLKDIDPEDTAGLEAEDKPRAQESLQIGVQALAELQDMLYAQDRWAVLLIFQAMDAAGKDSAIKHVMSGVNPQGCQVVSFKEPSTEDLEHDYLWRCSKHLPERGRIGIFNRSYYEEVLVVRVHEELLQKQKLPPELITKHLWEDRFRDIRGFERYLSNNGVLIRKFFLHVSTQGTKEALSRTDRQAREALEVLCCRCARACLLAGLHGSLRGHDPSHRHRARAVVCSASGQQMVHASGCGRCRYHCAGIP